MAPTSAGEHSPLEARNRRYIRREPHICCAPTRETVLRFAKHYPVDQRRVKACGIVAELPTQSGDRSGMIEDRALCDATVPTQPVTKVPQIIGSGGIHGCHARWHAIHDEEANEALGPELVVTVALRLVHECAGADALVCGEPPKDSFVDGGQRYPVLMKPGYEVAAAKFVCLHGGRRVALFAEVGDEVAQAPEPFIQRGWVFDPAAFFQELHEVEDTSLEHRLVHVARLITLARRSRTIAAMCQEPAHYPDAMPALRK